MKLKATLILPLLALASIAYAQAPEWVQAIPRAELHLTEALQHIRYQNALDNPKYQQVMPVRLGLLRKHQVGGSLTFKLPGEARTYVARPTKIEYLTDDHYSYQAEIVGLGPESTLTLLARRGQVFGDLTLGERSFRIMDLGQHQHLLLEYAPNAAEEGCAVDGQQGGKAEEEPLVATAKQLSQQRTEEDFHYVVSILLVYTPLADNEYDPQQVFDLDLYYLNTIMENNGLGNTLTFEQAGIMLWNNFAQGLDMEIDLGKLVDNGDIQQYRNQVDADIVVAFASNTYGGVYGIATGEVEDSNRAHAIVEIDAPSQNYTVAHEVAHIFNCRHNPEHDSTGPPHAHGYQFSLYNQAYRTLMGVSGGTRVPYVSDPDKYVYYQPIGVAGLSDNEQQLRAEAQRVCRYRGAQCNPDLSIAFSGPYQGQAGQIYTWCATVDNCDNTVGYYWEKSTDGINYSYAGNTTCVSLAMPQNSNLWLRLRASCAGKEDRVAYYQIYNSTEYCKLCRSGLAAEVNAPTTLYVYPNPSRGTFTVDLNVFGPGKKSLALYTTTGQRVWASTTQEEGAWTITPQIPPGLYTLQVMQGGDAQQTLIRVER